MTGFDDQPTLDASGKDTDSSLLPPGARFPYVINSRYQCRALIGHGSSGSVYQAHDHQLHRDVAIKFIHRSNLIERQRLLAEGRILAQLDHPNICRVYEVAEEGDAVYLVMSLIKGQPLNKWHGQFNYHQLVSFIAQICAGLEQAHRDGIMHCDIKPANIVLQQNDTAVSAVLVDFGIAYYGGIASASSSGAGTEHYMAPERSVPDSVLTPTLDIYALGATLRILLTQRHDNAALDKLPRDLQLIITRCLAPQPQMRYSDASALRADLQAWLTNRPVSLRSSPVYRLHRLWQRSRWLRGTTLTGSAVALCIVLAAGVYQTSMQDRQLQQIQLHERATRIENQIDAIYRSPVHDTRRALNDIRQQVSGWLVPDDNQPNWLTATQLSAAGRVLLQLNDNERAEQALTEAWQRGEHSDNTAMALAVLHQRLFTQALANARNLAQEDVRQAAIEQAHLDYRQPALTYLDQVKETRLPADYLNAMRAYLSGDEHAAQRILRHGRFPDWFYQRYELGLVISSTLLHSSLMRRAEGDFATMLADTSFFAAELIARTPSHSYAYQRMSLIYNTLYMYHSTAVPEHVESWLDLSEERLTALAVINPDNPAYHQNISSWAYLTANRTNDLASMQRAVRHAEIALRYARQNNYNDRQLAGYTLAAMNHLSQLATFFINRGISTEQALQRYFVLAESLPTPYRGAAFYTRLSNAYRQQAINSSPPHNERYWQQAEDAIRSAHAIAPGIPTVTANLGVFLMRRAPYLPPSEVIPAFEESIDYLQYAHTEIPGNMAISYNYSMAIFERLSWHSESNGYEWAGMAMEAAQKAIQQAPNQQLAKNLKADLLFHFGHLIYPDQSRQEQLERAQQLVSPDTPDGLSLLRLSQIKHDIWTTEPTAQNKQALLATLDTIYNGQHRRAYIKAAELSLSLLASRHQMSEDGAVNNNLLSNDQLKTILHASVDDAVFTDQQASLKALLTSVAKKISHNGDTQAIIAACADYQQRIDGQIAPPLVFGELNWQAHQSVAQSIEILFDIPCQIKIDG